MISTGQGKKREDFPAPVGCPVALAVRAANALERHDVDTSGGGSTASQYYLYNHRGDVVGVTDSSGVLKYLYEYDAYGNITADYNSGGGSAPTDDILMTGKDKDDVSGLYYFNARWYDPELGRYISRTPLAPHVEGAYLFCEDNPVSYYDDNGLKPNKPRPEEPPGEPMPGVLETIGTGLSTISVFIPLPPVQIAGALGSGISGGLWIWRADQHLTCGLFTDWLGSFIYWAGVAQFTGESATSAYAGIAGPDFPPYDSKNPPPDWIHPLIGWIGGVIGGIHLGGGDCYPPSPGNPRGLPPWQLPKQ